MEPEDNNIIDVIDNSNNIISTTTTDINLGNIANDDRLLDYLVLMQLMAPTTSPQRRMSLNSWRLTDVDASNNAVLMPQTAMDLLASLGNMNNSIINSNNNSLNQILNSSMNEESQYKNILSEKGEGELKKIIYEKNKHQNERCSIMHIDFEEGDEITQLPCGHCFNNEGILHWLKNEKAECPICRKSLDSIEVKKHTEEERTPEPEPASASEPEPASASEPEPMPAPADRTFNERRSELMNAIEQLMPVRINYNFETVVSNNEEDNDLNAAILASLRDYNNNNNNNND